MPTYLYQCETCGAELDVVQRITDDALTEHTHFKGNKSGPGPWGRTLCNGPVKRLIAGGTTAIWKGGAPTPKTYV